MGVLLVESLFTIVTCGCYMLDFVTQQKRLCKGKVAYSRNALSRYPFAKTHSARANNAEGDAAKNERWEPMKQPPKAIASSCFTHQ